MLGNDYGNSGNALASFTTNDDEEIATMLSQPLWCLEGRQHQVQSSFPHWKQQVDYWDGLWNNEQMCTGLSAALWPNTKEWVELLLTKGENSGKWTTFWIPTKYKGTLFSLDLLEVDERIRATWKLKQTKRYLTM